MDKNELSKIAKQMVAPGKGILAADESMNTVGKRFSGINLENTEDNRRAFREMLLTAPGEGQYIAGVILFDETIRQKTSTSKTFVEILNAEGILPGIKVDQGLYDDPASPNEKLTKGLDGLSSRLMEYVSLGAKFAKWRSVITINSPSTFAKATADRQPPLVSKGGRGGTPTEENIRQNAKDLAAYALVCQEAGLVPMVEPEVLLDGNHSIQTCEEASEKILTALFEELKNAGVVLEGTILKTSMVLPGKDSGQKASPLEVAEATLRVFKKVLPKELAGEAFLSGGQSELEATANLNAINQLLVSPPPSLPPQGGGIKKEWPLTFSFARALQDGATKAWQGNRENMQKAQTVFLHRAKMNSLASLGKYAKEMEADVKPDSGGEANQD